MLDPGFHDTRIALEAVKNRIANKPTAYIFKFIDSSIINSVLMKGLLYSRSRFDIEAFELDVQKQLKSKLPAEGDGTNNNGGAKSAGSVGSHLTVAKLNEMDVRLFKETSQKIIAAVGYNIVSDVRFPGDHDYIDGNAVNYIVKSAEGGKSGGNKVFSIRRFDSEVDRMAVGQFLDWIEEKGIRNAIYVASNSFDKTVIPIIQKTPNVKFIDQNGLSKMLMRIK